MFISKIESALPPTEAEVSILSQSLDHADLRLVDGLRVVEIGPSKGGESSNTKNIASNYSRMRKGLTDTINNSGQKLKWKRIQGGDDFAIKKYTKFVKDDDVKWGKATTMVHTSPEDALAWLWDYCSNERMRRHQKKNGNILRKYYDPETQQRNGNDSLDESRQCVKKSRMRHVVVRKAMAGTVETRESNSKLVW